MWVALQPHQLQSTDRLPCGDSSYDRRSGFTIVELLIVIVVIGILAAITIVAYNGVTQRAKVATLQSDLESAAKELAIDQVTTGTFPATLAAANSGAGIKASPGTSYQYTVDTSANPQTFCITATNGTTSYFVTSADSTPSSGGCPGDGVGGVAAITNLVTNPSFTTSTAGWANSAGTDGAWTSSRPTTGGVDNGPYLQYAFTAIPTASAYVTKGSGTSGDPNRDTLVSAGTTYTASGYVRASWTGSVYIQLQPYNASNAAVTSSPASSVILTPNTWTRLSVVYTMPAGAVTTVVRFYVTKSPAPSIGSTFAVDQVMVAQGSTLTSYADGNSPNWIWNGTANVSTSTGPPS